MMNNKIIFSGLLLALLAVAAMVILRKAPQEEVTVSEAPEAPVSEMRSVEDQRVLQAALESPETFGQSKEETRQAGSLRYVPAERPKLLSEVERPARERVQKEPVAASDLYFWKDYESLRKDEIRNPDSKENRAGVVALMKARQRRVGQK